MKIIRKHERITLEFVYYPKTYADLRHVFAFISIGNSYRTIDYQTALRSSTAFTYTSLIEEFFNFTLSEYLWLLSWKPYVTLWYSIQPRTFNPFTLIPHTPPLNEKTFTVKEKAKIKKLKNI